jgi:competence protein ComEA
MGGPFTLLERPLRMVRSLLIKLAMLAVTLGSLVWIGSVTPIRQVTSASLRPAAASPSHSPAPASPVSRPAEDPSAMAKPPSPTVGSPITASSIPVSAPAMPLESLPSSRNVDTGGPDLSRRVDLNHATPSDLEALPGIGPKLAQRVIEHRASHGPFKRVEDLRQVKGIGHKKFDRLRSYVVVTQVKPPARPKGTL